METWRLTNGIRRQAGTLGQAISVLCLGFAISACGGGGSGGQSHYLTYSADGLSFRYPRTWLTETYKHPPFTFSTPIVNLSTTKLRNPCITTGSQSVCGLPLNVLPPRSVLVLWSEVGRPTTSPIVSFPNTTLGDRAARVVTGPPTKSEPCSGLSGTTTTITAEIQLQPPDNEYDMTACLRGPDLDLLSQQINSMLKSVAVSRQM